jgi:hypothetical protein
MDRRGGRATRAPGLAHRTLARKLEEGENVCVVGDENERTGHALRIGAFPVVPIHIRP